MAAAVSIMTACGAQDGGASGTTGQSGADGQSMEGDTPDGAAGQEAQDSGTDNSAEGKGGNTESQDSGSAAAAGGDGGDGSQDNNTGTRDSGAGGQGDNGDGTASRDSALPDYLQTTDLTGPELIEHTFSEVTVHDPSVIKAGSTWYVFGSHLAGAKTDDLMNWTLIDSDVKPDNVIIPNAKEEMKEAFEWARTDTFWAPDVIQPADGKFYMYYCNCEGSSPLSALGLAVADNVEGPYKDLAFHQRGKTGILRHEPEAFHTHEVFPGCHLCGYGGV